MHIDDMTLGEGWRRCVLTGTCKHCSHRGRVNMQAAIEKLGPSVLIRDIAKKLRCSSCGSRAMIWTTLDAAWTFEFVRQAMIEFPMPYDAQ
jgi:hypothetical protein